MMNKLMEWLGYIPKPKPISMIINKQMHEAEEIIVSARYSSKDYNDFIYKHNGSVEVIKYNTVKNNMNDIVKMFNWNKYDYIHPETGIETIIEGKLKIIKPI